MSDKSGWWYRATTKQKLAQIDGGIECGLVARHVAMLSACGVNSVRGFAWRHGRSFPDAQRARAMRAAWDGVKRHNEIGRDRRAYIAGERVDFWHDNPTTSEASEVEEIILE